jgi:hypothetical protein
MSTTSTSKRRNETRLTMKHPVRTVVSLTLVSAFLVPAAVWAAVSFRNPVRSGVRPAASCIVQQAGGNALAFSNDATGPLIAINSSTSVIARTTLLQTTVSAEGFPGERTVYPDVLRIRNACDRVGSTSITIGTDVAGTAAATGAWADVNMSLHLSAIAPATLTADLSNVTQWNQTAAVVTAGTVTVPSTGTVLIPAGSTVQIALVVDAGTSASTSALAELRWVTSVSL